jgi:hypothetical protein
MSDIKDNYDQDTFEGFWQQKANETTATLQRLLDNDAAAFLNLALKEIETQLLSGAEVINNPLKVGILSQLGFDISSGKIPAFFTEIFGDNDTLPSLDVATSFGLTEDQFNSIPAQAERLEASEDPSTETEVTPEEGDTFTFDQLVDRYNDAPAAQDFGVFVTYDPKTNTFIEDVSSFGFEGDAATNTYTPEEFMERLGVEGSFEEKYSLPENEGVDLASLTPEQQADIWPDIKKALEGVSNTVGKIIFGPKGTPTSVDEWLDWVEEKLDAATPPAAGTMSNLPFPIVLTTTPDRGTWLDLKIPVNIEVNGNPIRIPLFDEDGNFVGSQEIKDAVVTSAGEILGPLGQIGSILTDGDGKLIADIKQIGNVLLNDLSLSEDGTITGSSSAAILVGELFFNEDGEWEEVEEVDPSESTVDDAGGDGLGDTTADNGEGGAVEDPGNLGLVEDPDGDEEEEESAGSPYQDGSAADDFYGSFPVDTDDTTENGNDDGGDSLDGLVTQPDGGLDEDYDTGPTTTTNGGDDGGDGGGDNGNEGLVTQPDGGLDEDYDTGPTTTTNGGDGGSDNGGDNGGNGGGDGLVTQPDGGLNGDDDGLINDGGLNGDDDGLINDGGENDDDLPVTGVDEEPLVGPAGPTGATGATGAAGAPGSRSGYMGGLSYELPQFVGVQYQPKDYTVELDRIINESLFKGMI